MADKKSFTGLSLGSQNIAGAVFGSGAGGGLVLQDYHSVEMLADPAEEDPGGAQLGAALMQVSAVLKLKGKAVRYSISSQPVFIRFVGLPPLDIDQVDQIVEFEAQQNVPFPINEVVWGYQLMGGPDDPEVEVMLAAIKADELAEIDDVVSSSGIKTIAAEVAPMALFNAFRYNYSDVTDTTLLLDIGARTTNLIYVEAGKAFIRTIKIGGAEITKAIAKEFGVSFEEAEQRKIADGFVALGGPYADHEDPVIAGLSKVIRNTLTRLHSEIMRTTNFYRSQQGGSAPQVGLLCGGSAGLPYIRDFFAEKLNIPIDYFNALRNVEIGGGVNAEEISAKAHCMGELVGGALREAGSTPVELDLIPESVKATKVVAGRKPFLWVTTFVLTLVIVGVGSFYKKAAELTNQKAADRAKIALDLERYDRKIGEAKDQLEVLNARKDPYVRAAFERGYWLEIFKDLNARMETDRMWITVLEPLSNGQSVMGGPDGSGGTALAAAPLSGGAAPEPKQIDAIRIKGLYRQNLADPNNSAEVVNAYFDKLKESLNFDFGERDRTEIIKYLDPGTGDQPAWSWMMELPLPEAAGIAFQE
jgi:type IV pilus assembly protein PilM